jgi:integrase
MGRKSEGPRYIPQKNGWFMEVRGQRLRLTSGPKTTESEKVAGEKWAEEMAVTRVQTDADRSQAGAALNAWLYWCRDREDPPPVAPNTLAINTRFVVNFLRRCGPLAVRDIRRQHFDDWLAANKEPHSGTNGHRYPGWGPGTRRLAMNTLRAAFSWLEGQRIITANPFKQAGGQKTNTKRVRYKGKRLAVTDREHELLLRHALCRAHKDFAWLLLFLYDTGARPAEMYLARADEWDEANKCFVIRWDDPRNEGRFKLAHLGEDRRVYLPDRLVRLARVLMGKYPQGPFFRDENGNPWDTASICSRFTSTIDGLNRRETQAVVRDGVTAYSYRHAFVTRWLRAGHDPVHLCELIGTSLTMLHRHYSHLFQEHETLRATLNRATGPTLETPALRVLPAPETREGVA